MRKINKIVIHHSASSFSTTKEDIRRWHLDKGYSDIGYHYLITAQGRLEVGRSADTPGAHAYMHNKNTLGVCFIGNFEQGEPLEVQMATAVQLLATLCKRHKLSTEDIIGHRDLMKTACPGKLLYKELPQLRANVSVYLKGKS